MCRKVGRLQNVAARHRGPKVELYDISAVHTLDSFTRNTSTGQMDYKSNECAKNEDRVKDDCCAQVSDFRLSTKHKIEWTEMHDQEALKGCP